MGDLDQLAVQLRETAELLKEAHQGLDAQGTAAAVEVAGIFDTMLGEVEQMLDYLPVLAAAGEGRVQ
jgi:hypothetical protein